MAGLFLLVIKGILEIPYHLLCDPVIYFLPRTRTFAHQSANALFFAVSGLFPLFCVIVRLHPLYALQYIFYPILLLSGKTIQFPDLLRCQPFFLFQPVIPLTSFVVICTAVDICCLLYAGIRIIGAVLPCFQVDRMTAGIISAPPHIQDQVILRCLECDLLSSFCICRYHRRPEYFCPLHDCCLLSASARSSSVYHTPGRI